MQLFYFNYNNFQYIKHSIVNYFGILLSDLKLKFNNINNIIEWEIYYSHFFLSNPN